MEYLLSLAGFGGSGSVTARSLVSLLAASGLSSAGCLISGVSLRDVSSVEMQGSDLLVGSDR